MAGVEQDRPLCVVLVPSGVVPDPRGTGIDFDAVYRMIIEPAVVEAGLDPLRLDDQQSRGGAGDPVLEQLALAELAVADVSTASPGVLFALGARHAAHPSTTVVLSAAGRALGGDLPGVDAVTYRVDGRGLPSDPTADRLRIVERLRRAPREAATNSLSQLLGTMAPSEISRVKTDVFRDRVAYSTELKHRLRDARAAGPDAVRAVRDQLGDLGRVEVGAVVDLLLSLRATGAVGDMIDLVEQRMPAVVVRTTMVQEQYAFALNRAGRGEQAEVVLLRLVAERGPATETYSLLGRVYKDRWEAALERGDRAQAGRSLDQAIEAYRRGFETDWRDAFPGINAVELMEIREPPDPARHELLPVVRYASQRRLDSSPDYWDHATLLEAAILERDEAGARAALADALATVREPWEPRSTQQSVRRLRLTWEARGGAPAWLADIEHELGAGPPG